MIILAGVTKSIITNLKNRLVTALGYNVIEATEVAPAGVDCPPTKDMLGLYLSTDNKTSPVFVGYVNKNLIAAPGERRIFATDADGNEVGRIWYRNNGNVNIGGTGDSDNTNHAVQWEALDTQLALFLTEQKAAITAAFAAVGVTYPLAPYPDLDITSAKEDTILIP